VPYGNAFLDACNVCVGGTTELDPCLYDCNNVPGGDATFDECGICGGPGAIYDCGWDGLSECWDGSETCDIADCPEQPLENTTIWVSDVDLVPGDISINLFNDEPVSGFQFNLVVNGLEGTLTGASGGIAEDNGFTVSTSPDGIVLGFSFSGAQIPVGQGVLTVLSGSEITGDTGFFTLDGVVLSDAQGSAINASPISTSIADPCASDNTTPSNVKNPVSPVISLPLKTVKTP
jgi:hypothetical protein